LQIVNTDIFPALQVGDCGTWVVEATSGIVFGHVVACDDFGDAYVVPIEDTLESIRTTLQVESVSIHYGFEPTGAEQQLRDQIQVHVAATSLEESWKAIIQYRSAVRLTLLAFIFVPLSFVSAFFGMNVPLSGGIAPTWQLWVMTGTIVAGALLILWPTRLTDASGVFFKRWWSEGFEFVRDVFAYGPRTATRWARKEEMAPATTYPRDIDDGQKASC
jgi:hypothetical protein